LTETLKSLKQLRAEASPVKSFLEEEQIAPGDVTLDPAYLPDEESILEDARNQRLAMKCFREIYLCTRSSTYPI